MIICDIFTSYAVLTHHGCAPIDIVKKAQYCSVRRIQMLQYALEVPKRVCVQFAVATYICSEVLIYIYFSSG